MAIRVAGSEFPLEGKLGDISLGGCYVGTLWPLNQNTEVELTLRAAGDEVQAKARVVVSPPGMGMALVFAEFAGKYQGQLEQVIERASGAETSAPEGAGELELDLPETTMSLGVTDQPAFTAFEAMSVLQAVVEVLEKKGVFTHEEFREALEHAKNGKRAS